MKIIWCMIPEIWSTTDRFFSHFGPCFALLHPLPLTTQRIKILKKWKKFLEISSFYTSVPKIRIICFTVPEIWHVMYVYNYFSFSAIFGPFKPPNIPKNENFNKNEKRPGDIMILEKSMKNHDHMLHCSWDMAHDTCNCYFSFWAIFCPFTPITAWKMKNSKKWTPRDIINLHKCIKNHDYMLYCSYMACNCYLHKKTSEILLWISCQLVIIPVLPLIVVLWVYYHAITMNFC